MMKTWHKWSIGGVAALVLLVGAVLTVLDLTVDPSVYRQRMQTLASQAVGREVTIRGPITLSVWPWLAVNLRDVRVANASGVGRTPLATMQRVSVTLRPLALVTGRLAIGTVNIHGLDLALARNAAGQTNWQGVVDAIAAGPGRQLAPAGDAVAPSRSRAAHRLGLASPAFDALGVEDAVVHYDDAVSGRHWRLGDAQLHTGRMTDDSAFRIESLGHFSCRRCDTTARLHLIGRVQADLADRFYRFADVGLNVLARGDAVPGGEEIVNLGAAGEVDFKSGRFTLDSLSVQGAGVTLTGRIDGEGLDDHLRYHGRVAVESFSPRSALQQLRQVPPTTPAGDTLTRAGFDAQFEGDARAVHFRQVDARLDDSRLSGTATLAHFAAPRLAFVLSLDQLDLDDYFDLHGPFAPDTDADEPTSHHSNALAVAWLRRARLDGTLAIDRLTAAELTVADARIGLHARNGRLDLDTLLAAAYGGQLDMRGRIDLRDETPRLALSGRLHGLDLGAVLTDLAVEPAVHGRLDADMALGARGRGLHGLRRSLGGDLAFRLENAIIDGYDLGVQALPADNTANDETDATVINTLAGHFHLQHGVANGRDTRLATTRLTGTGQGRYDIARDRIDYRFDLARTAAHENRSGASAGGAPIARLILGGALFAPSAHIVVASPDDGRSARPASKPAASGA